MVQKKGELKKTERQSPGELQKHTENRRIIRREDGSRCVSLYDGKAATQREINKQMARLIVAFPKLDEDFFDVLIGRIKANEICIDRLSDAVDYVIDNCQYPTFQIGKLLSFDKQQKVYTRNEACDMCYQNRLNLSENFLRIDEDMYIRKKRKP